MVLHVRFTFGTFICRHLLNDDVKMTKFKVLWRRLAHDDEFSVLSQHFQPTHTSLIPRQLLHIFNAKRHEIVS